MPTGAEGWTYRWVFVACRLKSGPALKLKGGTGNEPTGTRFYADLPPPTVPLVQGKRLFGLCPCLEPPVGVLVDRSGGERRYAYDSE